MNDKVVYIIAGCAAGGALVAIVAGISIFCCCRQRKLKKHRDTSEGSNENGVSPWELREQEIRKQMASLEEQKNFDGDCSAQSAANAEQRKGPPAKGIGGNEFDCDASGTAGELQAPTREEKGICVCSILDNDECGGEQLQHSVVTQRRVFPLVMMSVSKFLKGKSCQPSVNRHFVEAKSEFLGEGCSGSGRSAASFSLKSINEPVICRAPYSISWEAKEALASCVSVHRLIHNWSAVQREKSWLRERAHHTSDCDSEASGESAKRKGFAEENKETRMRKNVCLANEEEGEGKSARFCSGMKEEEEEDEERDESDESEEEEEEEDSFKPNVDVAQVAYGLIDGLRFILSTIFREREEMALQLLCSSGESTHSSSSSSSSSVSPASLRVSAVNEDVEKLLLMLVLRLTPHSVFVLADGTAAIDCESIFAPLLVSSASPLPSSEEEEKAEKEAEEAKEAKEQPTPSAAEETKKHPSIYSVVKASCQLMKKNTDTKEKEKEKEEIEKEAEEEMIEEEGDGRCVLVEGEAEEKESKTNPTEETEKEKEKENEKVRKMTCILKAAVLLQKRKKKDDQSDSAAEHKTPEDENAPTIQPPSSSFSYSSSSSSSSFALRAISFSPSPSFSFASAAEADIGLEAFRYAAPETRDPTYTPSNVLVREEDEEEEEEERGDVAEEDHSNASPSGQAHGQKQMHTFCVSSTAAAASVVYSAGLVVWEMLTGEVPFSWANALEAAEMARKGQTLEAVGMEGVRAMEKVLGVDGPWMEERRRRRRRRREGRGRRRKEVASSEEIARQKKTNEAHPKEEGGFWEQFVRRCLREDPRERPKMEELLEEAAEVMEEMKRRKRRKERRRRKKKGIKEKREEEETKKGKKKGEAQIIPQLTGVQLSSENRACSSDAISFVGNPLSSSPLSSSSSSPPSPSSLPISIQAPLNDCRGTLPMEPPQSFFSSLPSLSLASQATFVPAASSVPPFIQHSNPVLSQPVQPVQQAPLIQMNEPNALSAQWKGVPPAASSVCGAAGQFQLGVERQRASWMGAASECQMRMQQLAGMIMSVQEELDDDEEEEEEERERERERRKKEQKEKEKEKEKKKEKWSLFGRKKGEEKEEKGKSEEEKARREKAMRRKAWRENRLLVQQQLRQEMAKEQAKMRWLSIQRRIAFGMNNVGGTEERERERERGKENEARIGEPTEKRKNAGDEASNAQRMKTEEPLRRKQMMSSLPTVGEAELADESASRPLAPVTVPCTQAVDVPLSFLAAISSGKQLKGTE
ncbi:uncharacterized protein MONOS_10960 [Monocercomonoides exilis]|uniref:uncharacterized protein n=1 Tax=Monocercomonoides exilis TaxID=2049356 RepID=UPI0035598F5E|nr:hypothetical protein MONOS_10960 [Monocercomonoides exilis]|eukprot:MONOS_10960.1-p1 / transcript=MONOS_10960.1 / gene=MONOS_10960 / organism=Monocercomonoides_exilis_PA203 / gene_product=unspecified product / transcript_product=unspecified product / location=Mono_scaffold00522:7047-10844(+) / protein_length=1265 / sequence_SO=supercontig / SO=protein_coding / is_pseudo=false